MLYLHALPLDYILYSCEGGLQAHSLKLADRIQQQDVEVCRLLMCLQTHSFFHEPGLMFSNFPRNSLTRG